MTFKEKLMREHSECIHSVQDCVCAGCPAEYGYEPEFDCGALPCEECWEREIPLTPEGPEQHDRDIPQGQSTRKYCRDCTFRLRGPNKAPCNECESGSRWLEAPVTDVDVEAVCKMPLTPEEQEKHDLAINVEIIRGYCCGYTCDECPAVDVCIKGLGRWSNGFISTSAAEQRAMLDAFKAVLPPEEDEVPAAPREIPQAVRKLVDARIKLLTEEIRVLNEHVKAREAERDTLCDYLRGENNGDN